MESIVKVLVIGATVTLSMWFAYLSTKAKAVAQSRSGERDQDAPTREEFEALNQQMAELAERVDFAERMLAQQRDKARISQPRE